MLRLVEEQARDQAFSCRQASADTFDRTGGVVGVVLRGRCDGGRASSLKPVPLRPAQVPKTCDRIPLSTIYGWKFPANSTSVFSSESMHAETYFADDRA